MRTSEVLSKVDGQANARKSQGSQEGCTLSSFVATNVSEVHFNLRCDFAECRSTRRSTMGMVYAVKHTSNLQGATGLNVFEFIHSAAHGLGLKAHMADRGVEMSLEILSDSSAARACASRRG